MGGWDRVEWVSRGGLRDGKGDGQGGEMERELGERIWEGEGAGAGDGGGFDMGYQRERERERERGWCGNGKRKKEEGGGIKGQVVLGRASVGFARE